MKKNYFLLMLVLGFCSCKKESTQDVANTQVDVYVAGYVSDADNNYYNQYATYWKNGIQMVLVVDSFPATRALSIAVSGNDVYAAGDYGISGGSSNSTLGTLWKNGAIVRLDPASIASIGQPLISLAVSGNDVYVVEQNVYTDGVGKYWKNDNLIQIPDGSANSIAVSGNDVYIAGTNYINSPFVAKYWKNGNPVNLTDGSVDSRATSITVSGNDVFVAGDEYDVPEYWKNGIPVKLTDGLTGAIANSIAVSGTDVYVAGTQWDGSSYLANGYAYRRSIAKYWKNGIPINLTDGSADAEAKSIAVSGNDVFVAGFENSGTVNVAKYWKNGSPVILGDVSMYSEAYSIFLAKK